MRLTGVLSQLAVTTIASISFAYVVQTNDTLSKIAREQVGRPVYGSKGSIQKILALNPQITNADLIRPGQIISINQTSDQSADVRSPAAAVAASSVVVESTVETSVKEQIETPAPAPKAAAAPDVSSGLVGLTALTRYVRLDGRDSQNGGASATFLSDLSVGAALTWQQNYSDRWQSRLRLELFDLQVQNTPTKRFASVSTKLASGDFELRHYFSKESFYVAGSAGLRQQAFVRSIDAQTLSLDKVNVPSFNLALGLRVFESGPFSGHVRAGAGLLGAGTHPNFDVSSGSNYFGEATLRQKLKASCLEGSLIYQSVRQSSSQLGEIDRTDIGLDLSYLWEI